MGMTIAMKTRLDPNKYNRGQLIHFAYEKGHVNSYTSDHYIEKDTIFQKNEKKDIQNVICVDWFECTMIINNLKLDPDISDIKVSENIHLSRQPGSTRFYNYIFSLYYMGECVGTLLADPSSSFMSRNQASFKMDNYMLYTADWLDVYRDILECTEWVHKSISRLDISIDGKAGKDAHDLTVKWSKSNVVHRKGKADIDFKMCSNKKVNKIIIGSATSEKQATIYDKSNELSESKKEYIKQFWSINGLADINEVYRFEIRLRSKITKHYDLNRLDDPTYLASIVMTETKNWFEFVYKGKDTNKHRMYKKGTIDWIDWSQIKGDLLPKDKAVNRQGIHRAKRLIKDLHYVHYVENKPLPASLINQIKDEYCLHRWYDDKIEYWRHEFEKAKKVNKINSN